MRGASMRSVAVAAVLAAALLTSFSLPAGRVAADPWIVNNPDGTADAIWNFTNPADYTLTSTAILGGIASLRPQAAWWNSTTAADFSGPDSATNVEFAASPGDVLLSTTSGPSIPLALQPGAAGDDAWLDRTSQGTNYGASTTMDLDGRNPQSRPILRFDLSAIPPGAVIDDAILSLYQSAGFGNSFMATASRVTAAWDEMQVTWNDRLTGTGWGTAGGDFDPYVVDQRTLDNTPGWRTWNVTQLVDLWYRGRVPNYGLILTGPNPGANSDKTFYSSDYAVDPTRRPRLDLSYRTLGATGEYVSKVGGPGSPARWLQIAWNTTARSFLTDEFNAAPLDSKWRWTTAPPAYDVNTTTPGNLYARSATGVDLVGPTFTGHVLANEVVGDFTATMKFSSNPTADGQKAGLIVLLNARNWFAVEKTRIAGAVNWQARRTADAVSTDTNSAAGNPIPAWARIVRAGNVLTAYTSPDGTAWSLLATYTPAVEYPLEVRVGVLVADGLSGVAHTVDVDYLRIDLGPDATAAVQTRTGDTTPVDGTWTGWSAPYPTASGSAMVEASRYAEFRLAFSVTYPDHTAAVSDVDLEWGNYLAPGSLETNDLVPGDASEWGNFTVVHALNGQTITYAYSTDSGGVWTPVVPPASLQAVSIASGKIRFRASLATGDTLVTPTVSEIRLTYRHRLDHFHVSASAATTAGAPFSVTVTAKDAANATLAAWTGTLTLEARLPDGVTPGGGTLGTTSLAITSGGTATLATETYTRAEVIRILAIAGSPSGLSGLVTVSPGPVDHVVVTPDNVTLLLLDTQGFVAQGYDAWDNPIAGLAYSWTVSGGIGTLNSSTGPAVTLTTNPPEANGTVQASAGLASATATVRVVNGTRPWVTISAPLAGTHLRGAVSITYAASPDAVSIAFEVDRGLGWTLIGVEGVLDGTFPWDTALGADTTAGRLRAIVTNNRTVTNITTVSPIDVDNTPPTIALGAVTDDQGTTGTITLTYTTDADVVSVDLSFFDGAWTAIGTDLTVDGSYVWIPGAPINGVTVRAVAWDEVGQTGSAEKPGVGTRTTGPNPPSIQAIPDLQVRTAQPYDLNLTFYIADADTPRASLGLSVSDPANVTVTPGPYPSIQVTFPAAGTYVVTFWVTDGTDTAWALVRVTASGNRPPALAVLLPAVAFDEDAVNLNALGAALTAHFTDGDGDTLTFSILDASLISSRVNGNATLDLWAGPNAFGGETIRVRAMDPSGAFAECALPVIVRPVNDAPVLAALADVRLDAGTTGTLDLTPYIADVDNAIADITVTVNSPYVTASGAVLTFAFPADWTQADLTVTISDGLATDERPLRVVLIPPESAWWLSPYMLIPIPIAAAVVIGMFAQRQRWRPAKAFLVDERGQLIREFALDGSCEVSYAEVYEAGALDAVEKPIRVAKYHAQAIRGDALSVVLLAVGPVSSEQAEFARELLVNVQGRFDDGVRQRLEEARSYEVELDAAAGRLEKSRLALDAKGRVFAEMMNATTAAQAKTSAEAADVSAKLADLQHRERRVREDRATVDGMAIELGNLRASLEARSTSVAELETDLGARHEDVQTRETRLERHEADVSAREAGLAERERTAEALRVQSEARLSEADDRVNAVAGRETAFEQARTVFEETQTKFQSTATVFEAHASEIRSLESRLAERTTDLEARERVVGPKETDLAARESAITEREAVAMAAKAAASAKADEAQALLTEIEGREAALGQERSALDAGHEAFEAERRGFDARAAELQALEGRTTERSAELDAREARVRSQEESIAPRQVVIASKEKELSGRITELDDKERRLTELGSSLEAREAAITEDRARIEAIRSSFDVAQKDLEARGTATQALEIELAARRKDVEEREARAAPIEEQLRSREGAVASQELAVQARAADLDERGQRVTSSEAALEERKRSLASEMVRLGEVRTAFEQAAGEFESRRARFEEESRRRHEDLNAQAKTLGEQQLKLAKEIGSFDAERQDKMQWISAKEIDLEARDQSVQEKEATVRSISEENAKRLAEVVAKEETLEIETDRLEKGRSEFETRKADLDRLGKSIEAKTAQLRADEATKAEEFRTWQTTIESEQAMLRSQKDSVEKEIEELRATWANRMMRLQQREEDVGTREAKVKSDVEWVARNDEDVKRRERTLEEDQKATAALRADVDAQRKELEQSVFDLQMRERSLREEAGKHADDLMRRTEAAQAAEAELTERRTTFDQQFAARKGELQALEAGLTQRGQTLDARAAELAGMEARLSSLSKSLADQETRMAQEKGDLQTLTAELDRRQVELSQASRRFEEESATGRSEAEAFRQSLAHRAAELQAGEERLQRESTALQDKLGAKAQELSSREKATSAREQELRSEEHDLEARDREIDSRERQVQAHETELAAQAAALTSRQADIATQASHLDETMKTFAIEESEKRREWESLKTTLQSQESQIEADAQTRFADLAMRAAELERRERSVSAGSAQLEVERARLSDAAKAQAAKTADAAAAWERSEKRFAELKALESTVLRDRQTFEGEKSTWSARRTDELRQLEMTRDAAGEQAAQAERLIQEAQRRANVAGEAERAAQRRSEEISASQKQLDARRSEVERAEQTLQADTTKLSESIKKLDARSKEVETRAQELASRDARLAEAAQEAARTTEQLKVRQVSVDAEAARLAKYAAEVDGKMADAEMRLKTAETKTAELVEREHVLTTELQRAENLMEDLGRKEGEIKSRERGLGTRHTELEQREANIVLKDRELREGMTTLERMRQELETNLVNSEEDRKVTSAANEEAQALKADAERVRTQADDMQKEVAKNMKFLQKKAVDVLDREESIREREMRIEEQEKALEARAEVVESKERSLDVDREEFVEKVDRLQSEVDKLRERAATAEKGGASSAEAEEWRRDIETRVKIIQKKAFDLLDREEKLRKREEDLRARAAELGVTL